MRPGSAKAIPESVLPIPEVGALREWRDELWKGLRTKYTADSLWSAAVQEAQGRDYLRLGMIAAANEARRQSARLVLQAALAAKSA